MFHFAAANSIEFLSASSQIFGALLGLLGLSYVRVAEARERNVGNLLTSLGQTLTEEFKLIEKQTGEPVDIHLESPEEMLPMLEKFQPQMRPDRYKRVRSQYDQLMEETVEMRGISKKFRLNCWLSATLIFLCILGLLIPSEVFQNDLGIFIVGILVLASIALWQAVQFFILIAHTKAFFIVQDE